MARLVFAGHDPERVMEWPQWVWDAIMPHWPALIAEEQLYAMRVAMLPHLKRSEQREVQSEMRSYARHLYPKRQPESIPPEQVDPEKAAEWFAAHGYKVVTSG